ncbi:MAG: PAS domain S-box protein [Candidatus Hydrogenedentes bacterium]|nr:PAS domain S-box protein [Candidatus Hydrogenedentota bacterium]
MFETIGSLFDTSGFPARWQCGAWSTAHGTLHIASDIAIWGAYMAIPATITFFLMKRRDVPFLSIFWLFAGFTFFCGTTHLLDAFIFWWPAYRFAGVVKFLTAVVSWATVLALIPVIPRALALPRLGLDNVELQEALRAAQKSEERLRHVIEAAPNGMVIVDEQGRIVSANSACRSIFGYESEELVGRLIEELVPPRHRAAHPGFREAFRRSPETRAMGRGRDLFGLCKNGSEIPVEIGLNPIESMEGALVLASIVDITERKHSEQMLARYTADLERSNRDLDEFAYVASHDLRSPLEGIASLAGWIEEDSGAQLPEDSRRHLGQIRQRVLRLQTLLDDLLQFSRAGRRETGLELVDVAALVQDTISLLNPPPGFRVSTSGNLPRLETFRTPLQQVFQNLMGNAIKHHDRAEGVIEVRAEESERFWTFTVTDDGPGIEPAYHERVFMMFETLRPRDRVEGSGMGLAIIRKLIETYGGEIRLESAGGQGAKFSFTWPKEMSV